MATTISLMTAIGPPDEIRATSSPGSTFRWSNTWFGDADGYLCVKAIGEDEADRLPTSFIVHGRRLN